MFMYQLAYADPTVVFALKQQGRWDGNDMRTGLHQQEAIDDLYGCARSHNNLGYLAQLQSDYLRAVRHYAEAETLAARTTIVHDLDSGSRRTVHSATLPAVLAATMIGMFAALPATVEAVPRQATEQVQPPRPTRSDKPPILWSYAALIVIVASVAIASAADTSAAPAACSRVLPAMPRSSPTANATSPAAKRPAPTAARSERLTASSPPRPMWPSQTASAAPVRSPIRRASPNDVRDASSMARGSRSARAASGGPAPRSARCCGRSCRVKHLIAAVLAIVN